MPRKLKTDPEIVEIPDQKMAVLSGKGAPDVVFPLLFPPIYKAVYSLKFDLKNRGLETFKPEPPRARYPGIYNLKKEEWIINLGVPVPNNTTAFPAKSPPQVKIETWQYGVVAQILHLGPYAEETPNILRLQQFITDSGYEIAGPHEEIYLTRPDAKEMKTIIRYQVKKK